MASPGGAKDATVIGTLVVAVGVGGKVIGGKRSPPKVKTGSGQVMLTGAFLSLRTAFVSVCSMAFPSKGCPI